MYLYVVGRGHSGSTILDIIFGNSASTVSVGELCILGSRGVLDGRSVCGCRRKLLECPFWVKVRETFTAAGGGDWAKAMRAIYEHGNVRRFWHTWRASPGAPPPDLAALFRTICTLEQAITSTAGKPHLFDSNKEPTRALFLLKYHPQAGVIHLIRDPRGIVRSHYWRVAGGKGFLFLRHRFKALRSGSFFLVLAAASWTVGNLLGELVRRSAPGRVMQLRYEDLRDDPVAAIHQIGTFFGLPIEDVAEKLLRQEPLATGHNVGGNHIRLEGAVRFDSGVERSRPPMPRWAELATLALCWPLMLRYGYLGRPGAGTPPGISARPMMKLG
jgi:hypothetical protein